MSLRWICELMKAWSGVEDENLRHNRSDNIFVDLISLFLRINIFSSIIHLSSSIFHLPLHPHLISSKTRDVLQHLACANARDTSRSSMTVLFQPLMLHQHRLNARLMNSWFMKDLKRNANHEDACQNSKYRVQRQVSVVYPSISLSQHGNSLRSYAAENLYLPRWKRSLRLDLLGRRVEKPEAGILHLCVTI